MQPMMWNVSAGGREVTIVATQGPNGKLLLRANGRLVTSPLAPEELSREFVFEGTSFRFTRDGEHVIVESLGEAPAPVAEVAAVVPVQAAKRIGVAFLISAAAMLILNVLLVKVHGSAFSTLRMALFASALLLAATGVAALRRLMTGDALQQFFRRVPWIVVAMIVPALMISDRSLHGVAETNELIARMHVWGAFAMVLLAAAAGAVIYSAGTIPKRVSNHTR